MNRRKFETPKNAISFRKSLEVVPYDETLIPKEFMREKITYEPDKKAIKEAIQDGEIIEGARLEEKLNIQIK